MKPRLHSLLFEAETRNIPGQNCSDLGFRVEAKGLEPSNLLTASQALYQLSYAPVAAQRGFPPERFLSSTNRSADQILIATTE